MFWEPSTPWFPRGISRLLLPQKVILKWVKPAHLCPHLLVFLLLSSKLKQICGVSLPVWAAVALYRRMKRSRRCIRNQQRSAALCSPLSLLLQHPPHAGTTAASVAVQPANNLQRAINFPLHDASFFLLCFSLPPALSALPSFLFFSSLLLIVLHLFIYLSDIQLLLSVHACKHFFVLSLRLKEHRADCYLQVHAVCQEESSYLQNVNFNSLNQQEHLSFIRPASSSCRGRSTCQTKKITVKNTAGMCGVFQTHW